MSESAEAVRGRTDAKNSGTRITLTSLVLTRIGVLMCVRACVTLSCDRCRQQTDVTCARDATVSATCERCHSIIGATWHPGTFLALGR